MNQPLISVIIPTFNRHMELGELLDSLYRQTYKNMQILVVNDKGEPVEPVVDCYKDMNIQIINMEANLKHVHARNRGLQAARGEFIMLCDDDDLLLPSHLERMLREIQEYDLVYSDVEIFDFIKEDGVRKPTSRFVFAYEHDVAAMRKFSTFVASGCLYRRELHDQLGLFDTEVFHYWDWDFFLRAVERFRIKRVPVASALYAFSQQGGNMSGQLDNMRPYLDLLSAKHRLGPLPTKNFFLLLEEPEVKNRRTATEILWDGSPFTSRFVNHSL